MTAPTLDAEPACPGPLEGLPPPIAEPGPALVAERRPVDSIPRETWDRLASANPWSTPFSAWAFHRAWWDAYGENAHDELARPVRRTLFFAGEATSGDQTGTVAGAIESGYRAAKEVVRASAAPAARTRR